MASKLVGYILGILGLVLLFLPLVPSVKNAIPIISTMSQWIVLGAGVVLIVLAVLMLRTSARQMPKEVPIYHGESVVGFRRTGE